MIDWVGQVAMCCSVLQCVAVCCSVLQYDQKFASRIYHEESEMKHFAVCYSVISVLCSILQCVTA